MKPSISYLGLKESQALACTRISLASIGCEELGLFLGQNGV